MGIMDVFTLINSRTSPEDIPEMLYLFTLDLPGKATHITSLHPPAVGIR
jgi:hypothetical protein